LRRREFERRRVEAGISPERTQWTVGRRGRGAVRGSRRVVAGRCRGTLTEREKARVARRAPKGSEIRRLLRKKKG